MTIEHKLEALRKRWKEEPHNRRVIEYQAKLLEMAKNPKKDKDEENVESTLF